MGNDSIENTIYVDTDNGLQKISISELTDKDLIKPTDSVLPEVLTGEIKGTCKMSIYEWFKLAFHRSYKRKGQE
jgi:hypothetical protein